MIPRDMYFCHEFSTTNLENRLFFFIIIYVSIVFSSSPLPIISFISLKNIHFLFPCTFYLHDMSTWVIIFSLQICTLFGTGEASIIPTWTIRWHIFAGCCRQNGRTILLIIDRYWKFVCGIVVNSFFRTSIQDGKISKWPSLQQYLFTTKLEKIGL